jgi:hypothetical protein
VAAGDNANVNDDLTNWVASTCAAVPATRWQTNATSTATATTSTTTASRGFGGSGGLQVYDCAGRT